LQIIREASETESLALALDDNEGVYMVPAFAGLGAPYWDAKARGAVLGLTRGSGRRHLARAALESIAYQTRDIVEVMNRDSGVRLNELRVDGGACRNDFLMQFQADLLGVPVERPELIESTAAGAAYLAGLAIGVWNSPADLDHVRATERRFQPEMAEERSAALYAGWQRAVAQVRGSQENDEDD
jgi:glycerol kinase